MLVLAKGSMIMTDAVGQEESPGGTAIPRGVDHEGKLHGQHDCTVGAVTLRGVLATLRLRGRHPQRASDSDGALRGADRGRWYGIRHPRVLAQEGRDVLPLPQ